MTICPNCSHTNPPGATQCEACFTPLPTLAPTMGCPSCGATIQADAVFCGQCGTNVKAASGAEASLPEPPVPLAAPPALESKLPATIIAGAATPPPPAVEVPVVAVVPEPDPLPEPPNLEVEPIAPVPPATPATPKPSATQLQVQKHQLNHIQSGTIIDIPMGQTLVHIGKPNEQVPPDIDVSGFPCSEVVSRIHADLRIDGDSLYLEDTGSANGTYINHNLLPKGNRHLLRAGDRISLGKGDLVTFLFQVS